MKGMEDRYKMVDWNLSYKIFYSDLLKHEAEILQGVKFPADGRFFFAEDVREFIKRLKEWIESNTNGGGDIGGYDVTCQIDKLVGKDEI